jgi:hypothetical protein
VNFLQGGLTRIPHDGARKLVYGGSENPYMGDRGNVDVAEMEGYEDDEEERAWRE